MRMLLRVSSCIDAIMLVGPANLISLFFIASFSGMLFCYRLLSRGYHRVFFSSK